MICDICHGTGFLVVEVPVFADGGYSDVDQVSGACRCNPDPTDADIPDWIDDMIHSTEPLAPTDAEYPDFDCPVIDYDVPNPWVSVGF